MNGKAITAESAPSHLRRRMLAMATGAFGICVAAWMIFSIIGVRIQAQLGLSETELGILLATPILTGSVLRLFLGIICEKFGGRRPIVLTMLISAACTWVLAYADTFPLVLLAALGLGLAGSVFIAGVAFTARWFPPAEQGKALGVFGAGNVGSALTSFLAPMIMLAVGWHVTVQIYAVVLAVAAVVFWALTEEDPTTRARMTGGAPQTRFADQVAPLRYLQVWRFGLYYFFAFGGFVALTSWLPRYYTGYFELDIGAAGMLTASFAIAASLFRALGGVLADRYGPRRIMYVTFIVSLVCLFFLSYPPTSYRIETVGGDVVEFRLATNILVFTVLLFAMGVVMSFGSAAVYKHIPNYYPNNIGSVGGVVGMIGGLGGFFMPPLFGALIDFTHIWTTPFMALFALVAINLIWMHIAIQRLERRRFPGLKELRDLPEAIPPEHDAPAHSAHGAGEA